MIKDQVGNYKILAKLGEGGMGAVYKAYDLANKRTVALKFALSNIISEEVGLRRFEREIRAISRLSHPNITAVYDSGRSNGNIFYAMEFIDGSELKDYIRTENLSEQERFDRIFNSTAQVLRALSYIHSQRIIHRDLKPSNIMVAKDHIAKIMDFGLAKDIASKTMVTASGLVVGTADYMSPEQGSGKTLDQRTDLYSLGVILYEISTGRKPFSGDGPIQVIIKHIQEPPIPPRKYNSSITPMFEEIILKLMEKSPIDRFQTADETIEALKEAHQEFLEAGKASSQFDLPELEEIQPLLRHKDYLFKAQLVGRDHEFEQLVELVDQLKSGFGSLALLKGEAGVGKSRLVEELLTHLKFTEVRIFKGHCYEQRNIPYQVFSPIFDRIAAHLNRRGSSYAETIIGNTGKIIGRIFPIFNEIPYVKTLPEPAELPPGEEKIRLLSAIKNLFERLAAQQPCLFYLDNLHWSDEGSIELLEYLVENLLIPYEKAPIMFIGTIRSEELSENKALQRFQGKLQHRENVVMMEIKRLEQDQVGLILQQMLGMSHTPTRLTPKIFAESGGNPFFIEEVLNAMIEDGILYREGSQWQVRVDSYSQLIIPSSIKEVLKRRFRNLGEEEMDVLRWAAVIGEDFEFDVLMEAGEFDEDLLLDVIDQLLKYNLIFEKSVGMVEKYIFYHGKIRDVLYDEISQRRKKRHHLKIANAIEKIHKKRLDKYIQSLAYHYYNSPDLEKAFIYSKDAGLKAKLVFQNAEAINFFNQATQIYREQHQELSKDYYPEFIIVLTELGETQKLTGSYDEALETYQEMIRWAQERNDEKQVSIALGNLGDIYQMKGEFKEAKERFNESIEIAKRLNYKPGIAKCLNGIGIVHLMQGDYNQAMDCYNRSLEIEKQFGNQKAIAKLYNSIGAVHFYKRAYEQALDWFTKAYQIREELGDKSDMATSINNLGSVYDLLGQKNKSIPLYKESLKIAQEIGKKNDEAMCLHNIGYYHFEQCNYQEALRYFQQAYKIKKELGNKKGQAITLTLLGSIFYFQAKYEQSLSYFNQALAIDEETEDKLDMINNMINLGDLFNTIGMVEKALQYHQMACDLAVGIGDVGTESSALAGKARDLAYMRKHPEALEAINTAIELSKNIGMKDKLVSACLTLADIRLELGEPGDTGDLCAQCLDLAKEVGVSYQLVDLHLTLARIMHQKKQFEDAIEAAKRALSMAQELQIPEYYWKSHLVLGNIYREIQKNDECLKEYKMTMEALESIYKMFKDNDLKKAYISRRDRQEAIEIIREFAGRMR